MVSVYFRNLLKWGQMSSKGGGATSYMYICPLSYAEPECSADEAPLTVAKSTGTNCEDKSETIPVQDCHIKAELKKKLLGACPSPAYKLGRQDILEFIEMNKALGVDLVSLYLKFMTSETEYELNNCPETASETCLRKKKKTGLCLS